MTATLVAPAPTGPTFARLTARELRRFVVNPVFLLGVAFALWTAWAPNAQTVEIGEIVGYPAVGLGGFGLMATYWLTRSMRASEPVVGVTPTAPAVRTAALCAVSVVPLLLGVVALAGFLRAHPLGSPLYGGTEDSAQVAMLIGQIVVPALGGPLLGVALGRWISFPGAGFALFLLIYGWQQLTTILSVVHPEWAMAAPVRLFSPFVFWSLVEDTGLITHWPGNPWFFMGWQLGLCGLAVLVALLRDAEGQQRLRRALWLTAAGTVVLYVLTVVAR